MKKIIAIGICIIMAFTALGACVKTTGNKVESEKTRTIIDSAGNEVELPSGTIKAASNAAAVSGQIIIVAGVDAVGIAPASFSTGHTKEFEELYRGTDKVKLADGNKIAAETLLEEKVNVFFTSKADEAAEYEKYGLSCVVLNFDTVDNIANTFHIIGEVFGGDALKTGDTICNNILENKRIVEEGVREVQEEARPTVYYIAASTQTTPYVSQGEGTSTYKLLELAGARQVTTGKGLDVAVSAEYILEQNPDYILIDGYLAKEAYAELVRDPMLKELDAVKNGKIITAPVGMLRPYMRPGAESGIGLLWLAKTFSPNKVTVSIEEAAKKFYSECLGIELGIAEVQSLLKWAE